MSSIAVTEDRLTVRLSRLDRVLGLLRDQDVPRSAITGVDVVADGIAAVRGVRAPGLALPGRRVGTWRSRRTKSLVDVRRLQPAVRVRLTGHRYDELLLGTDEPESVARQLRS